MTLSSVVGHFQKSKEHAKRYIVHFSVQNIHVSRPFDEPEIKSDRYFERDARIAAAGKVPLCRGHYRGEAFKNAIFVE